MNEATKAAEAGSSKEVEAIKKETVNNNKAEFGSIASKMMEEKTEGRTNQLEAYMAEVKD